MKSIVELQREDHAHMNELFERYRSDQEDRKEVFRKIVHLVTTHAFAEEEVLFPAARRATITGEVVTKDIESKHQRINDLLRELESLTVGDPGWEERVNELFPLLSSDAREEEDMLLPALQSHLDEKQLGELGTAWTAAKRTAPNRSHPEVPREPPGNALAGVPLFFVDRVRALAARMRNRPQ